MIHVAKILLALIVLGYALACVFFYFQQRSLLYFPVQARGSLATMEVPGDGTQVRASVANAAASEAIVYFGGNAEDVSISALELGEKFPDLAVYALHYRGYGESAGSPSESALVSDAMALLDEVARRHEVVSVVGRSLGSGIALQATADRTVKHLALVTPFGSIRSIAQRMFWFLPVSLLIRDSYTSTAYVHRVQAEVTILVAEHDEVIPAWSTQELIAQFEAAGQPAVVVLKGRGHNDVQEDPVYWNLIAGKAEKAGAGDRNGGTGTE